MKYKHKKINRIVRKLSENDDENALRDLFEMYHGKLLEAARFYVNDDLSAKEIVSEVFIKIWRNRSSLDKVQNISSYLFVATKRQALNYLRDNKRSMMHTTEDQLVNIYVEFHSPEKEMISQEFEQVLAAAINDLPSKCRLVYAMVKDEGMKYAEVADALDVSVKTVEMHVGKALKRIRWALMQYEK